MLNFLKTFTKIGEMTLPARGPRKGGDGRKRGQQPRPHHNFGLHKLSIDLTG